MSVAAVLTIGETMTMVVPSARESVLDAEVFRLDIGGAESNVAVHLVRNGVPAAWLSSVGADLLGDRLLRALHEYGVDVDAVLRDPLRPTGLYVKDPVVGVTYYRTGSAASALDATVLDGDVLHARDIVHVSGITPALSPGCHELFREVARRRDAEGYLLSFDVNFRPTLWPDRLTAAEALAECARSADLVFVGRDEAAQLWGRESIDDIRALLPEPATVVIKDGAVGAWSSGQAGVTFVPTPPIGEIVEEIGAGDAFAAGYLAAVLRGASPEEALTEGHRTARRALSTLGDV